MQSYRVEFTDDAKQHLSHRCATSHAAFFVPHLKPGMRLLDCGCGPGSVTIDLAEIVAPAEVIGIDTDPAQLALARLHAERTGVDNVCFEQGDVMHLPFPDQTFDAMFVHAVIEYLPKAVEAYAEIKRVLKPGGLLGSRHSDWRDLLFAPATDVTQRFFELFRQYMQHCGGEPEFDRHQFAAIRQAGFQQMRVSASCDRWTPDAERTHFVANFLANYTLSAEFAEPLVKLNLTTAAELQTISDALREWSDHPDAFLAEPWGEAVAWRL